MSLNTSQTDLKYAKKNFVKNCSTIDLVWVGVNIQLNLQTRSLGLKENTVPRGNIMARRSLIHQTDSLLEEKLDLSPWTPN